jgi:hypothetical protein
MCEYCEKNKPICNELDKKVEIINNCMLVQRKIGNIFDAMICNTTFNLNYCPMCGRKLG